MQEGYDIAIIGAGPAGATCALALRASGLRVALIDKAAFPRDKVCGDAIPARAMRVLREVAPESAAAFAGLEAKAAIAACKVVGPRGSAFTYTFHTPGYCARRLDFDAFLVGQVVADGRVDVLTGFEVEEVVQEEGQWRISGGNGTLAARLLIGCDGANGVTARRLADFKMDPDHHCAAVRAYYTGVAGLKPDTMEIHLLEGWLPGYFWIFPLGGDACNVGFGMLSRDVAARKVALRPALGELIAQSPALRARFAGARLHGRVQGFGLPLGSRWVPMSGDGFLLCGDAASLIDPATGEGIGNAMWSGQVAARWALSALRQGRLDAAHLQGYADELRGKLHRELRRKYRVQQWVAGRPRLLDWLLRRAGRRGLVSLLVRKLF